MKRIVLFLFCIFGFSAIAQMARVQLMVKPGYLLYENTNFNSLYSNDTGLNQIISPYFASMESTVVFVENQALYSHSFGILTTDAVSATALVNDLNNYDSVVYYASIEQFEGTYNHYLNTRLSNLLDGNLVSIDSNGLVVTSNTLLNTIFQQFNVNFYELAFPSSTSCCLNLFTVGCQFCDTTGLKTALQGLEGGVLLNSSTSNIPYAFLSIDGKDFEKMSILFPNPTTGIFEIQINGQFQDLDLEIFDNNGRIVYKSKMNILQDSSQAIDISSLSNGIYFLRVKNEQFSQTEKIIKK